LRIAKSFLEETVNYMEEDPFSGLGLREVALSDQSYFQSYFNTLSDPLSDYTFAQFFSWGNSLRILWKEIRGHLCIFANGTGDLTLLMPPIGDTGSDAALAEAFEVMDTYNAAHNATGRSRVEYVSDELLKRFAPDRLALRPMGNDYLYSVERMIDLAGGDLASKRQLKNRFLRNYQSRVEVFEPEKHLDGCMQLLKLWKHQQDDHHASQTTDTLKRQKETLACELALRYAMELNLKGLVVYVQSNEGESSLRGFTFGEELGADQSSIIIEKTDLGVKGLAQFIFSEFCQRFWSHRPLVNAGDDWGLESLAWTKMSYRPVKLLQKYDMRLAAPVAVAVPQPQPAVALPALPHAPAPVVRPARKQDLAAAVELEQTCFSVDCLTKRQLNYLQQRPSTVFLVAEDGGKIVGDCISLVRKHKRGQSGRIYSLAVKDGYRGRKIGQRLLSNTIADLCSRGVRRVYLEVDDSNSAALQLYEKSGFKRLKRLPDYYGEGKHAIQMMYEAQALATPG
jgi:ribosomal-protein-alanine acetyltransferase